MELIRVCSRAQHQALWYELRNPGVIHRVFVGRIILGMSLHLAGGVYFQVVEEQVTSQNTGEWDLLSSRHTQNTGGCIAWL